MAIDSDLNWHRTEPHNSVETTVRLSGDHYEELSAWAQKDQISGIFNAAALSFGFTENLAGIGNLSRELSHPESLVTLAQWSENPYVAQLVRLQQCYLRTSEISNHYPGLTHAGTPPQTAAKLRKAGAKIAKQHFLLHMIINPLAPASLTSLDLLRRMLRLWIVIEALKRTVEHQCCRDQQIQVIASYMTLPVYDPKWHVIDKLLEYADRTLPTQLWSYEQFTLASVHPETRKYQTHLGPYFMQPPKTIPYSGH